jgi:hypothetical protein
MAEHCSAIFLFWQALRLTLRCLVPTGTKARVIGDLEAPVVEFDNPRLTQQPSETAQTVLACHFGLSGRLHYFHDLRARKIALAFHKGYIGCGSFKLINQIGGTMLLCKVCERYNFGLS